MAAVVTPEERSKILADYLMSPPANLTKFAGEHNRGRRTVKRILKAAGIPGTSEASGAPAPKKRPWTPAENRWMAGMYLAGLKVPTIAKELGRTPRATTNHISDLRTVFWWAQSTEDVMHEVLGDGGESIREPEVFTSFLQVSIPTGALLLDRRSEVMGPAFERRASQ